MKGLYWLILGLCVWFIPSIIFQVIVTSEDSDKTAEEAVSEIPIELVIAQFVGALIIIVKGVVTIRRERRQNKNGNRNSKR